MRFNVLSAIASTSYSETPLTSGTTYTYKISAFNSAGNSLQYSNEVTVTTLSQHLPYTIGPNVTDIDGNIVALLKIPITSDLCNPWNRRNQKDKLEINFMEMNFLPPTASLEI